MMNSLIAVLCLLIFCSGFFSASETALFSLSSMKVKAYKNESDKRKQLVFALLSRPRELLITIIMLNVLVNILVQNVVSMLFGDYSSWALNVGVPLALTLVFGEIIPKSIGLANNAAIAYRVAPWLKFAQIVLFPIRKVLIHVTSRIANVFFGFLKKEKEISFEELEHALTTSQEYGVLNPDEAQLARGYLNLQQSNVRELMRPREEIIFFDIEDPISKLLHLFVEEECTRVPVCRGSSDDVLGIVSTRLFFLHRSLLKESPDLIPILKKPFFVPETMKAEALLNQMFEKEESLAIVVDEYGSISGLISLEDLVEVVLGEISDRRDEKKRFTQAGKDVIIASGKLELEEFEEIFGVLLPSESNVVTIGGWLAEQLGEIPKGGTKYSSHGFLFHVLASDPNRIRRVYIRRLTPHKEEIS